jgi:hypothetical protein
MLTVSAVVLSVGVLLYALLVREAEQLPDEPDSPLQRLEERRAAIYDSLRDLAFDFRTGKLSESDYQLTKHELQQELAAVNAELARLKGETAGAPAVPPVAAVAEADRAPASRCPHCGAEFPQPMKFCGECGKPMSGSGK